jgi:bifunctional non-homologous end joining protein LigD
MLAREAEKPFDHKDWIYELKWDGYRAIAETGEQALRLYSRNGNSFNTAYPIVVQELERLKLDAVLDGEIVVLDESGKPDFQLLQNYSDDPQHPICYYVFDILFYKGENVCSRPLLERKALLKKILKRNDVVRYADHIETRGIAFFRETEKMGMEGIIAKKADSKYLPGTRTSEWLKIKHHRTTEAVIAGFTEPTGSRKYFGALVLGMWKGNDLVYVGHTGTGFNEASLGETMRRLEPLIVERSPFSEKVRTNTPVTWVRPELVCELKFSEITRDGKLRHPVFLHMREDKSANEIRLEMKTSNKRKPVKEKKPGRKKKEKTEGNDRTFTFGKIHLKTTNNQKIFWPGEGFTKGDVIDYYDRMADIILPYLGGRPESLKRNPNGIKDGGFFQKDAGGEAPRWVKSKKIFSESVGKKIDYILCENKATLLYLANLGCIEINPWHSTVEALDHPDYLVIDIDPSPANSFDEVIETAQAVHEVLEDLDVPNFCKTSGATGLHVYVPSEKKYTYEQVKDFALLICMAVHERLPRFTSLERSLKVRGKKIYLDHLQNRRGQTIAAAYSLRPHPGATVSTPLHWKEVKKGMSPKEFNIVSVPERSNRVADIFSGILGKGLDLMKALEKMEK